MKKIISLICAVVMMLSCVSIVASANDTKFYITSSQADGKLTLEIHLKAAEDVKAFGIYYDISSLLAAGATFVTGTATNAVGGQATVNTNGKFFMANYNAAANIPAGDMLIATAVLDIANVAAGDYALAMKTTQVRNTLALAVSGNISTIVADALTVTVEGAGPTEAPINVTVEKLVGEVTEKQDYAYAADITVEGNPTQLIWSVLDGTRKYSAAQDVEGVAGNVKVGFVSENDYDETTMGVLLTNEAKDTIWYSVEADLANEAE